MKILFHFVFQSITKAFFLIIFLKKIKKKLALGLIDYPQIIKTPMDLGTVKKNLKNNKYKYVEETIQDIQLVWDNCKKYNAEGSVYFNYFNKYDFF